MEKYNPIFPASAATSPAHLANGLASPAHHGHFDELRGRTHANTAPPTALAATQSQLQSPAPHGQLQSQSQHAAPMQLDSSTPNMAANALTQPWTAFFNFLGSDGFRDLDHRTANLRRQIRDNGVTYNVYADANGPQRPWSLDLFPLILSPQDWAEIATGIKQRTCLLNRVLADVYGPQTLLSKGLLPAALVQGHPGYLRAMQGVQPAGGVFLHIAAFDLARGPDGRWWVVSQRTQAPSGLGYLLENRLTISQLFPEAFREMNVQRLAASFKALVDGMRALSPVANSRIVLLTPGPYNETYFEHAYLARYLGLSLVEGSDLLVRDERLYLKTLQGLEPVHGLLKRLDDEYLDPLELRSDSTLGVPGLLQVIRAGNVQVANAPGSAFLESSALLGFLPALSQHLLGQTLSLPSLATWWCGEQAVMQGMLPQLKNCVIKPTYPGSGMASVMGHTLSQRELDEWAARIIRQGEDYTVQAYLPLSQTPTWQGEKIALRSTMLRVFAVPDGAGSWRVLPGGLARLAGKNQNIASMQHGGSSADVWALAGLGEYGEFGGIDAALPRRRSSANLNAFSEPHATAALEPAARLHQKQPITSRAAENLFWLGRYTERAENSLRLAKLTLQCLGGEDQSCQPLLAWLTAMAVGNSLVLGSVPPATQARLAFERSLIAGLTNTEHIASVGFNLNALKNAASAVRERLSQEQWRVIVRAQADFFDHFNAPKTTAQPAAHTAVCSPVEALRALEAASSLLAAMTGAQTDRMMRDDGWRLLSIGRHIERLGTLSAALAVGFETRAVFTGGGFSAIVAMFDSTITFHAQYQQRRDVPALLDLLVADGDNPRSLSWVVHTLKNRMAKLHASTLSEADHAAVNLPDPASWVLATFGVASAPAGSKAVFSDPHPTYASYATLVEQLENGRKSALVLSNYISQRYFSHAASTSYSCVPKQRSKPL